ncbi:GMC oxidoreductase [Bradyrhizobium lablabi]|uniref:GMC oxidoreductase n=1 Tax=Bradyrhizobium lablabi TaxID=722472 RepID=UPI001BA9C6E3|nr:GMC family oxidoreductase [Bradyrhizobium lablabi]MBR0695984.1 GMC family oxidoreductase [Bradyrhizobium lablabi]
MRYDIIIVGTGAGGGTLAWALAQSGKRILMLERGEYISREPENWSAGAVIRQRRYRSNEIWYDEIGRTYRAPTHYCVGGNTKFYGSALLRFRRQDFDKVVHAEGISPAWPLNYSDFEPYYTRAEWLYDVHGERGIDPTEPAASAPYPHPRIEHAPRIAQLESDLRELGYHPFHVPLGLLTHQAGPERCVPCATCGGFACFLHAKADAQIACVDPALKFPNVTILTGARAVRLHTDASGCVVTAVEVMHGDERERYEADIVVVSCGALNSAALLLRSANSHHPGGLANGSGVVGRFYMRHINSCFVAVSHVPNDTIFQKTLAFNDFYFGEHDFPYPMGNVQLLGRASPESLAAGPLTLPPDVSVDDLLKRGIDLCVMSEDLPNPDNRLTLAADGSITMRYSENNMRGHLRLISKLTDTLEHIGCAPYLIETPSYCDRSNSVGGVNHQCGTVRFGTDPRTSALDINCKAHELDNLYVVDSSFFPSSGSTNPSLTIAANALRVGDHILEKWQ